MSEVKNQTTEQEVNINRAAIEHRATWMALIFGETKKSGCNCDAEKIFRTAIKKCGNIHGLGYRSKCADPNNMEDFCGVFLTDIGLKTFDMEITGVDKDNLKVEFHYCPLLSAWKKLGVPDEELPLLCEMAMDGDRGIAESMGVTLDLPETIAKGDSVCKLHFHK